MSTIKHLQAKLATATTARERAEINAGIAFLKKQAAARAAACAKNPTSIKGWAKKSGMSEDEYRSFHGC